MGFGNIAATIILFIAVLLIGTAVIISIKTNVDQTQTSMRTQAEFLNNQIKTNVQIISVNYTAGRVRAYVQNNGKTVLDPAKVDLFLDNNFVPRDDLNRTIVVEPSTDVKNPGLWDPDEVIRADIYQTIAPGTHQVAVLTQYGVKDEETFSI